MLQSKFYSRNALIVAKELLGKVIQHKYKDTWLKCMIIETEAYMMSEKASHSYSGYTDKKKALFMPPGTIYMYYSRGKDSLNISVGNEGDAVLIKSGVPYLEGENQKKMIEIMKKLNPKNGRERETMKLCSGQTLLAKSLNIKLTEWNEKQFDINKLFIKDVGYNPDKIIATTRLGIPKGRDEHLFYRFVDYKYYQYCTKNPITKNTVKNINYKVIQQCEYYP